MMLQRTAIAIAVLGGAIGITLPAQAQSAQAPFNQSRDLQISVQEQNNRQNRYSDEDLDGLANQINETADPAIDSNTPGVYPIPDVEGFPDNLVIIESGLDTSSPEDTIGDYAIGVSF